MTGEQAWGGHLERVPGGSNGSRPDQDAVLAKRARAIQARAAGMTYEQVAKAVGYSDRHAARKAVLDTLTSEVAEAVADLRALEGVRLDRLQAAVWATALGGDLEAVDRVLRIMAARARLFGLNAPVKVEMTDEIERQIATLAAELGEDGTWNITGIPDEPMPPSEEAATLISPTPPEGGEEG